MRCASMFTLAKDNRNVIIRESVKISNAYVFSPICDLKIRKIEYVGTCAVEVRFMWILLDSSCIDGNASRSYQPIVEYA